MPGRAVTDPSTALTLAASLKKMCKFMNEWKTTQQEEKKNSPKARNRVHHILQLTFYHFAMQTLSDCGGARLSALGKIKKQRIGSGESGRGQE